jgi:hypothetical protein
MEAPQIEPQTQWYRFAREGRTYNIPSRCFRNRVAIIRSQRVDIIRSQRYHVACNHCMKVG